MKRTRRAFSDLLLAAAAAVCLLGSSSLASEALRPLSLRDAQVGGEIGRRIAITITNNLLVLDADHDFLPPFKVKTAKDGYIRLGKLIGATVKFAACSGDSRVDTLRRHLLAEVIQAQEPDGFCLNPAQDATLAKLDGTDLGYLALDPDSLGTPVRDDAVRPRGLACKVSVWKPGFSLTTKADYELILTEFPDPGGKATYFRLRDFSPAVPDELFTPGSK